MFKVVFPCRRRVTEGRCEEIVLACPCVCPVCLCVSVCLCPCVSVCVPVCAHMCDHLRVQYACV